jgi:hypothetical protein
MIEKQDAFSTGYLVRKLRESPQDYFKCYPNLSWALAYRIVFPNDFEAPMGTGVNVTTPILPQAVVSFRREILLPEYRVAEVIEGFSHSLIKVDGSWPLSTFLAELGISGNEGAFDAIPIHCLGPNAIIYVLWMTACSKRSTLARYMQQPIDLQMFQTYPNLTLALHLCRYYGIDKALGNVLAYTDRSENALRDAVPGSTIPDLGGLGFYGVLVAIASDFYCLAGIPVDSLVFMEHMRRIVGGSERFESFIRTLL